MRGAIDTREGDNCNVSSSPHGDSHVLARPTRQAGFPAAGPLVPRRVAAASTGSGVGAGYPGVHVTQRALIHTRRGGERARNGWAVGRWMTQ